ncbi:NAD(P)-dependent oxidoreductase [Mucilaginibacter segetis]|uniref:NAD(P)H-binding protein n=1 Tax=Mucilaginibacter segetis TaxID=2793071 RepID=A0A934PRZ0_9SPHI|nr:NAD(P)H-binding protein [Mucilaginibacter segetis]MBK0379004.1 NAD(P)H-binding protein [Mucilaginibacter segetis]
MKTNIKLAIIGGTGKAGKYLVKQLIFREISFKLLHRNPDSLQLQHPFMELVKGDARNYEAIERLLDGCNAVISTIGQPVGEPSIFSIATKNVLHAMRHFNIRRYIAITGLNVDTPLDNKSPETKFGTEWMYQNYPKTTADKQLEYNLLVNSDIKWTLVRLPIIQQTDENTPINIDITDCPGDFISATSLANFIIAQLKSDEFVMKAPFIANR